MRHILFADIHSELGITKRTSPSIRVLSKRKKKMQAYFVRSYSQWTRYNKANKVRFVYERTRHAWVREILREALFKCEVQMIVGNLHHSSASSHELQRVFCVTNICTDNACTQRIFIFEEYLYSHHIARGWHLLSNHIVCRHVLHHIVCHIVCRYAKEAYL